jgi:hypothetical protein
MLACAFVAQTAPLAMVVLRTAGRDAGRLPAGWGIRVNRGKPVVSVCVNSQHTGSVAESYFGEVAFRSTEE